MDLDDVIQTYLPLGSTIPVRYDGSSAAVSNESRCFFTKANYQAAIGSASGYGATIALNTNYSWDYDPSNGGEQQQVLLPVGHGA